MKLIVLFHLLAIVTAKTKIHPNTVNLALETSLIFDGENTKKDLSFIDNLQNLLKKLKSYLKLREQTSFRTEDIEDGIFTQFIKDFSRIIINYDNEALKNLTDIVALVMEPHYYKGTTFHKIIQDEKLKTFIKDKIMEWADTDPKILKYQMATALMSKENTPLTVFGSYLNKFFSENDSKRLKKYLKRFNKHETSNDMHKLVKKALGFLIFHRYNKLNETDKKDLLNAINNVTDFLINVHNTPKFSSPKNDYPNHKHTETFKGNNRRSQADINTLLPKKIVLHKNVEFNVRTPDKEMKEAGLMTDIVTEVSMKPIKVRKWEKVPYIISMEVKLNKDKHIAVETREREVDTIIVDSEHSANEGQKIDKVNIGSTLSVMTVTEAANIENDTKITTLENKDNTHVDLYKQIMSINIGGENGAGTIDIDAEHQKDIEHKTDNTRQPETMALIRNSEDKNNITNNIETKTIQTEQDETLNKTESGERRMGVFVKRGLPDVDIAELNTDTEELKMKIDMNPHESATKPIVDESNSNEKEETVTIRHDDDIVESDKEEYQNKIADGAKKISNLLDNAIAMKLLGIT